MKINGHPGNNRAHAIEQGGLDKVSIDVLPGSLAEFPNRPRSHNQNDLLTGVKQVEAVAVGYFVRRNILPGNNNKQIQIEPPGEQEKEVQRHQPERMVVSFSMRLHGERRHHWNNVKK